MPLVATRGGASASALGWSSAPQAEELGGMVLLTPTSITYSGTSASIGANGSVEFSACSSLSLNGVFSATYDNYMVAIRETASGNCNITAQLLASGTPSATGYTYQFVQGYGTTVNAGRATLTYAIIGEDVATQRVGFTTYLFGPNLAQPTAGRTVSVSDGLSAQIVDFAWTHSASTSYDGIKLAPTGGNFTGLVSVYGLVGA